MKKNIGKSWKNDYILGNPSVYRDIKEPLETSASNVSLRAETNLRHSRLTCTNIRFLVAWNVVMQRYLKMKIESSWGFKRTKSLFSNCCWNTRKTTLKYTAKMYLFQVNNRNSWRRCKICSKLTAKTTKQCYWSHSGAFIDNSEHI